MEENEHINEHLKNSLRGFTVPPRIDSFDAIQKKLEKKRRRRFLFFLLPGLLLLAGAGLWLVDGNVPAQHAAAQHKETPLPETITKNASQQQRTHDQEMHNAPQDKTPVQEPAEPEDTGKEPKGTTAEHMPEQPGGQATQHVKTNKDQNRIKNLAGKIETGKNAEVNLTESTKKTEEPEDKSAAADPLEKPEPDPVEKPVPVTGLAEKETAATEPLITEADELAFKTLLLPPFLKNPELLPAKENALLISPDSLKKTKRFHYYVGAYITPQCMSYMFTRNKTGAYPIAYLQNKREQNAVMFANAWGLKALVRLDEKWEFSGGFDFQTFRQDETLKRLVPAGPSPNGPTTNPPQAGPYLYVQNTNEKLDSKRSFVSAMPLTSGTYRSTYKYWGFSLAAAKLFTFKRGLKAKLGAGLRASSVRNFLNYKYAIISVRSPNTYYYWQPNTDVRRGLLTLDLKAGLIEDLTKRLQVQFCPVLFYNVNSMFVNNYFIDQRAYGAGLECSLLFRLR